jgi:hypothetical protein
LWSKILPIFSVFLMTGFTGSYGFICPSLSSHRPIGPMAWGEESDEAQFACGQSWFFSLLVLAHNFTVWQGVFSRFHPETGKLGIFKIL